MDTAGATFTINGFRFTDSTTYSQGATIKIPTVWKCAVGSNIITVTNGHRDYRPEWVFHCHNLGFTAKHLPDAVTKEDAAETALRICTDKVTKMYKDFKQNKQ
jgi:hypothetical protein